MWHRPGPGAVARPLTQPRGAPQNGLKISPLDHKVRTCGTARLWLVPGSPTGRQWTRPSAMAPRRRLSFWSAWSPRRARSAGNFPPSGSWPPNWTAGFEVSELSIPPETAEQASAGVAQADYAGRPDVLGRLNP